MSGIDAIKKKAKLSMDEMYEDQPVGKPGIQNNEQQDIQNNSQTDIHMNIKPTSHTLGNQKIQPSIQSGKIQTQTTFQDTIIPKVDLRLQHAVNQNPTSEFHVNREIDQVLTRQPVNLPSSQTQASKMQTYKMTFNLPENVYKAFNDLYAQRMLQGRKTEKANLICEAIDWLVKMENQN